MASDRKVERSVPAVQSSEALLQQLKGADVDNHRQTSARERERGRVQAEVSIRPLPLELRKIRGGGKKLWEPEGWGTPGEQCPPNQLSKGHGAHRDGSCHRRACTGLL